MPRAVNRACARKIPAFNICLAKCPNFAGAHATPGNVYAFQKGAIVSRLVTAGFNGSRLFLAEFIQALLHLVELALELIHFAARTLRLV